MKEFKVKISSVSPLLMNNINSMFKAKEKPLRIKADEWEQSQDMFLARTYSEGDSIILPSRLIKGVLKEGAKGSGIKQPGKRSGYADLVQSVLFMPEGLVLDQKITELIKEQAFVGMNGTKKVLRVWPKLTEWSGELNITIADEKQFPVETLEEILQFAGRFVGMGDYRPEFGRFEIE